MILPGAGGEGRGGEERDAVTALYNPRLVLTWRGPLKKRSHATMRRRSRDSEQLGVPLLAQEDYEPAVGPDLRHPCTTPGPDRVLL